MKIYALRVVSVSVLLAISFGCATERFGRQTSLTEYERKVYSCKDIELEMAKTSGFIQEITEARKDFKGTDVWGLLGDFGIGNAMEFSNAMESATERLKQLEELKVEKGCLQE